MRIFRPGLWCCLLACASQAGELAPLLSDEQLWQSDPQTLATHHKGLLFAWKSADHQAAAIIGTNTLFELPVVESSLQMSGEKPAGIAVVFYNRGDAGDIPREEFAAIVSNAQQRVGAWAGRKPVPAGDQLKTTGVRRDGLVWTTPATEARLLWSYSTKDPTGHLGFRAEYVKLHLVPAGARPAALASPGMVSASGMKAKIRRDAAGGDVLLHGLPMVDQGEKGYCAVASAERVMRFYGMAADQHELAQLAASSAEGGTDPRNMLESLRRVGVKLGCKVRVVEDFSFQEFVRLLDRYNQAARKKKMPEIKFGNEINLAEIYREMDTAILREVRTKQSTDMKHFLGDVAKNIEQGVPLLWGVQLGLVDEKPVLPKQAAGGHMRLIIGYNPKTSEVLYTDSWGHGHELKRMTLEDAWTITCSLYLIEPRHTTL